MKKYLLLLAMIFSVLFSAGTFAAQKTEAKAKRIIFIPLSISNPGKVNFDVNTMFFNSLSSELLKYGGKPYVPENNFIDSVAEKLNIDFVDQTNAEILAKALHADILIFGQVWEFSSDASGNTTVNASIYMIDGKDGSIITSIKYLPGNFYYSLREKTPFKVIENISTSLVETLRMQNYL